MSTSSDGWTAVLPASDLREGTATRVTVGDAEVMLYRRGEQLFAIGNRCTHQGAALHAGRVRSFGEILAVTCPAHGSMFRLDTGAVMRGPAMTPEPAHEVRIAGDSIEVRIREA